MDNFQAKTTNADVLSTTGGSVIDLEAVRRRNEGRARWKIQRGAQGLLQNQRVAQCQRSVTSGAVGVQVAPDSGCAHFSGVITCGSVWHCPVCADRITADRRRELQDAIAIWSGQGGAVYLCTFTFPHDLSLPLAEGLERMQKAQAKMKGQRAYKLLLEQAGAIGTVKALEVTYGHNGWHPHIHALIFARPNEQDTLAQIRPLWAAVVEKGGLGKVNEHGFDIRGGDYAAEYVAKYGKEPTDESRQTVKAWWTAGHELARGHVKQGQRMKGATPFTLLRWYVENNDAQAGALFSEYASVFKGRRQLFYSPGMKERLDLFGLERTKPERQKPVTVARIDWDGWSAVLRHEARYQILYIAERYGGDAVDVLVAQLKRQRGKYRGFFRLADPVDGAMAYTHEAKPERLAA